MVRAPVLLGGYASRQCARRVHNEFDPTIPKGSWEPPRELRARFDAGSVFEELIFDRLDVALGERCVRLSPELRKLARIEATLAAMSSGANVILEGQLPDDEEGGRVGKPDVLVRWSADGEQPTYLPADVKHHRTAKTSQRKSLGVSRLGAPAHIEEWLVDARSAEDDSVRLAARKRLLVYNEDDVATTAAIRDGLRALEPPATNVEA